MSFDFHILYDSIIHSLQNWLPVNLIAVTLVSHKYANIIRACRAVREQKGGSWGNDLPQTLRQISSLLKTRTFVFSLHILRHFWGSRSNMFCQNTACLLVTANLITQNREYSVLLSTLLFWVVLFPLWLELRADRVDTQQRDETVLAVLMKIT